MKRSVRITAIRAAVAEAVGRPLHSARRWIDATEARVSSIGTGPLRDGYHCPDSVTFIALDIATKGNNQ